MFNIFFLLFALLIHPFVAFADGFQLQGSYLLEYSIFKIDVYEVSFYQSKEAQKLVLDYKTKVKKKYTIEGWKVGLKDKLKDPLLTPKVQWFFDNSVDVIQGDKISLIKTKEKLELLKNDKLIAETSDPVIVSLAFEPWLGDRPVDKKMKSALLGEK